MRILMVTHMTGNDAGGMADRVRGLITASRELGYHTDVMTLPITKHLYSNRLVPWWYLRPTHKWTEAAIETFPDYDLIVVSYLPVAVAALDAINDRRIHDVIRNRAVYDAHNDEARLAQLNRTSRERRFVTQLEGAAIRGYGTTWVPGAADQATLAQRYPVAQIVNVPNGIGGAPELIDSEVSAGEAFVYGSWTYPPNANGLRALAGARTSASGRVRVFGRVPSDLVTEILNLSKTQSNVRWSFEGFRPDLAEIMSCGGVGMIPVWTGGGTKLRTVQLLGTGIPTVITPEACSGLPEWIQVGATVAHTPEAMLTAALSRDVPARELRANGRTRILSELTWTAILQDALSNINVVPTAEKRG